MATLSWNWFTGIAPAVALGVFAPSADSRVSMGENSAGRTRSLTKGSLTAFTAFFIAALSLFTLVVPLHAEEESFPARIARFKDAEQWNLVVLHAIEWTRKEPQNPIAWNELGLGYIRVGQFDDAEQALRTAIKVSPNDPILWFNVGMVHYEKKEFRSAALAFIEAVRLNPKDVDSLNHLGDMYLRNGDYKEARKAFDYALQVNPENRWALCGAGYVAYYEKRFRDARAMVAKLRMADRVCAERLGEFLAK